VIVPVDWASEYIWRESVGAPRRRDRGARIQSAASGGTLQATFHWWYEAGDSVEYGAAWQLYGPYGVGPISTIQKQTTSICES